MSTIFSMHLRRKLLTPSTVALGFVFLVAAFGGAELLARGYEFDGKVPRTTLESYLSRSVLHLGFLSSSPEPPAETFQEDLRTLIRLGGKFIGRSAYAWDAPVDDEAHFELVKERAKLVHAADPQIILQACIFETAYQGVERIPVPSWVFEEFGVPPENRAFRYSDMLYDGGKLRDHWAPGASVPDMSKIETRLWFYYRARRYIDAGCEALHFGQFQLMAKNDANRMKWKDLLDRVRRHASKSARRHWVLCDCHVRVEDPDGKVAADGKLLFDFLSFPLRPEEGKTAIDAKLFMKHGDSIYGRSPGGVTPSGWRCDHLPYLAEFDNFGFSGKPRQKIDGVWIWGYDEISWFSCLSDAERDKWLRYAWTWIRRNDPNGWLQFCLRKPVRTETGYVLWNGVARQEKTIQAIWKENR